MDEADRAQGWEEREREAAIARARQHAPALAQRIVGGAVRCLDCDEPIAPARLAVQPAATRCIECEAAREGREKRR